MFEATLLSVPSPFRLPLMRLIAGLVAFIFASQPAFSQEYRQIEWADGRVWAAEVLETDAEGMRLRMVQGEAIVPYSEIQAIVPIEEVVFHGAPAWTVEILPVEAGGDETLRLEAREVFDVLHSHLDAMKGVEVRGGRKVTRGTPPPVVDDCGIPSTVSVEDRWRNGVDHIVVGHLHHAREGGRMLTLCSLSTAGSRPLQRLEMKGPGRLEEAQIMGTLYRVLGLEPDGPLLMAAALEAGSRGDVPKAAVYASPSPFPAEALPFVPLPGFPSLVARDMKRFGWAWAVVVPGTILAGLWIAEAGFSPGQVLFLTSAAYYTLTVTANRHFAEKGAADGS